MTCRVIETEGGVRAIVCTTGRGQRCTRCGSKATLLCDWKVPSRRSGTCDKPICAACTHAPAPGKDLCPDHAAEWQSRQPLPQPEARP